MAIRYSSCDGDWGTRVEHRIPTVTRVTPYKPDEWPTFWDDVDNGTWEPETKTVLERFLHPGDVFADVGAWCGPVTLWAVQLGATVVAWEPDAVARKCLRQNTDGMPVEIRAEAWADRCGQMPLLPYTYFGDSSSQLGGYREDCRIVELTTPRVVFNSVFQSTTPALIKVDIEGGEVRVLPDLTAVCRERRVPIYLSWHQDWWPSPVDEDVRRAWFDGYDLEPIRGDGWTGFSELLVTPR